MKKIFFFLLLSAALQNITAQLNTNLVVSPTPPSTLTEWGNRKEVLSYMVGPGQGFQLPYKIKTEIKLMDGTVIGRTDLAKATTYNASSTNTIYYAPDVIPLQNMIFTGKYKSTLEKTGKLQSDNYMICVRLVRPVDFTPVSEEKCRSFYLAALQLPVLLKPYNEEVLDGAIANTVITFRWSPVIPKQILPVTYRLAVFEVLENQNPVQAIRSNMPILDKQVRAVTQYIWQTQGIVNDFLVKDSTKNSGKGHTSFSGGHIGTINRTTETPVSGNPQSNEVLIKDDTAKKHKQYVGHITLIKREIKPGDTDNENIGTFVWTIQALDANGKPLGDGNINGDGVSEPIVFYVRGKVKDIRLDPMGKHKVKDIRMDSMGKQENN